jgi:hypothetical protein
VKPPASARLSEPAARLRSVHERYVREWLEQQAASDLLDVEVAGDGEQRRFRMPEGHARRLENDFWNSYLLKP